MILKSVTLRLFRNIVEPQTIIVEGDVTGLVGKNESGKTTVLEAIHRLKPANLSAEARFDLVTEYPRWRLSSDRKANPDLEEQELPVKARFALEEADLDALAEVFPARPPASTHCDVSRTYANGRLFGLRCPFKDVIQAAAMDSDLNAEDIEVLLEARNAEEAEGRAKELAKKLKDQGEGARGKAVASFSKTLDSYAYLTGARLEEDQLSMLAERLPGFFYFSDYDLLPGEHDLHELARKIEAGGNLDGEEESVAALLSYANTTAEDFLGDEYDARKAELQASALALTRKVFEYWTQNRDLEVEFDTELEQVGTTRPQGDPPQRQPILHRILKILMRDLRHGGISTNFETRSAGFRWFFSFLAAFSKYQESDQRIVVLLDEPGTSLHGEAQKDFLRFIFDELGASKQVIYTTHSQYLVDPGRYEKLRAVEDRSTRENPDLGMTIVGVDVSADPDTLLPIQAALGYSISQHLFLGAGRHLTVEGGSDFVYLQRMSEHLGALGRVGLDPRLAVIPIGGAGNTPAFVALFARHLDVSVLLDGNRNGKDAKRVLALAERGIIREDEVVLVANVPALPVQEPDIEDLLDPKDYLRLYNWAYETSHTAADLPDDERARIVRRLEALEGRQADHALPAYALTQHREEFFSTVEEETLRRFEELFKLLNATIPE